MLTPEEQIRASHDLRLQLEELDRLGYCLLPCALSAADVEFARAELARSLRVSCDGVLSSQQQIYGARNLLQLWPEVAELARRPSIIELVRGALGESVGIVRGLFFDKPPDRSWTLPWHRDRTIALMNAPEATSEFRNPTQKAGIHHATAPSWLLQRMLTVRFSLDPMTPRNGPLVVRPGSHDPEDERDDDLRQQQQFETICCAAGDAFVMRPLLAHSSLLSDKSTRLSRRVVHLEFCNCRVLPESAQWHNFVEF